MTMYTHTLAAALALTGGANALVAKPRAAACTQFPSNTTTTIQNALIQINLLEQVTVQNTTSSKAQFEKTDAALDAVFLSISGDKDEQKVCNFKPLGNPANSAIDTWANRNIEAQLLQQVSLKLQIVEQDVVNCDHGAALKDFCDLEKFWINGDGANLPGVQTNSTSSSTAQSGSKGLLGSSGDVGGAPGSTSSTGQTGATGQNGAPGQTGATGTTGTTGGPGSTGSTGQAGPSGNNGPSVINGPSSHGNTTIISGPGSAGQAPWQNSTSISTGKGQSNGTATSTAPKGQNDGPCTSPNGCPSPANDASHTTIIGSPVSFSTAPVKPIDSPNGNLPNVANISPAVPSGVANALQGKHS